MSLYAYMVVKDEAERYLPRVLELLTAQVDGVFVYDDHSVDGSRDIARAAGCEVVERQPSVPPFVEHEGKFRTAGLKKMADVMLKRGDWVVMVDADEFYVPMDPRSPYIAQPYGLLRDEIANAQAYNCPAIVMTILTVWGYGRDGRPEVRVDGLWPTVAGARIWEWEPGDEFEDKLMGSRTTPVRILDGTQSLYHAGSTTLLHYGYATKVSREERYDRYSIMVESRPDRLAGHHRDFIESIPREPTLEPWYGFDPLDGD